MQILKISLLASILFLLTSGRDLKQKPPFSYKVYGNVANYFEHEKDLLDFFEFKKGETVAEIGAGNGQNIAGFCLLTDSVLFYAQDINSKALNKKSFDRLIRQSEKYKKPLTNTFQILIGKEKSSELPENTFDKILLVSTFHEFTFMDEMVADISKKLKSNGKLYILETKCLSHKNYSAEETIAVLKKHNFNLVKKDGKDLNGGVGVYRCIFEKS